MTNRNDDKLAALQALLSISGGNIDDLEQAWLVTQAALYGNVNDMWLQVFHDNSAVSNQFNTAAKEYLTGLGYTGSYADAWAAYWAAGGQAPVSPYLVQDTFTDSDSTALASHTPDVDTVGGGWTEAIGGFDIQGNKCRVSSYSGNTARAAIDAGEADGTVNCVFTMFTGQSDHAVLFRYSDSTHFWMYTISITGTATALYEVNGGFTQRGLNNCSPVVGNSYFLNVVLNGTSIVCTTDCPGGGDLNYTSSYNLTETSYGLNYYHATPTIGALCDDFTVETT